MLIWCLCDGLSPISIRVTTLCLSVSIFNDQRYIVRLRHRVVAFTSLMYTQRSILPGAYPTVAAAAPCRTNNTERMARLRSFQCSAAAALQTNEELFVCVFVCRCLPCLNGAAVYPPLLTHSRLHPTDRTPNERRGFPERATTTNGGMKSKFRSGTTTTAVSDLN